ncbi:MAG: hypothetical protein HYY78_03890 [Betaproteobacteria bacterium]|nr:hypothetical protein [Betaproteobacteria bacterium]
MVEDRGGVIANVMHALVSAMVGKAIARSMDDVDWKMVLHALEFGRAGVPSRWRNPESRNTYAVTLVRSYDASDGLCLEYTVEAIIGGKGDRAHNTACRLPDGSWSVTDDR